MLQQPAIADCDMLKIYSLQNLLKLDYTQCIALQVQ